MRFGRGRKLWSIKLVSGNVGKGDCVRRTRMNISTVLLSHFPRMGLLGGKVVVDGFSISGKGNF